MSLESDNEERAVVGVFGDPEGARVALEDLRLSGIPADRVGLLSHDREGDVHVKTIKEMSGNKAGKGAGVGVAVGAGGGALWALGIAAGVLPAIGPVIAGGVLAAILASAAGGAAAGSVVGALVGLGVSDEEAAYYDSEFRTGRSVVVVKPRSRAEAEGALGIMRRARSVSRYHGDISGYEAQPTT